ncbi:hypothetical protein [African swine fever virus]|uniref:Uncharacterized protein n=1 Tax=African swine fever virus TaxID=10497 RepID=A0A3G1EV51_ASF|nr:hypothetical protein F8221_gp149 [African swine fever virus]AOO54454.1 hypothetical protein AFSV47Ss_0149 [African swine fever virus]QID21278.1 hypothetical protein AFSV47Ss_0149 [African swine fever virus]QIM06790.1 hypothetical protein [African swine fever virus]QIM07025.1 hypothetical protein [African swine fever virus]QIM07260.1 hypothetical protein [African swine fever virus]
MACSLFITFFPMGVFVRVSKKLPTVESCTCPLTGPELFVEMNQFRTEQSSSASTRLMTLQGTQRFI